MRARTSFAISLALCLAATRGAVGQLAPADRATSSSARVQAVRLTDSVIVVDGALDEPAWQRAPAASTFWQVQPDEGQPSSERTEVRILYTADTLYVGVLCHDREPGGIVVADSRRDSSLTETDSFTMILDTYRDRQNGFVFGTNPAGIEYDGQVTNEGQGGGGLAAGQMQSSGAGSGFNLNWDGAWTVKTRLTGDGWTAEFAIPFKTLRFPAGEIQTWGINFQRNIRRRNERAFWSPIPRQYDLNRVSLAGEVSGIAVPALRNLKVTPYALANALASGVDPVDGVVLGDVGGDLKYTLTPSLALDATVNTDFAQVEVDEQQVNLDRFNLFFPEKRPFFLENAGFFTVGNPGEVDLFFSRRIGLAADGEAIPILAGARVSGKAGPYNIGVLEMQTDGRRGEPGDNFAVVRVSRDLPNRSAFGGIFVNRQGVGDAAPDDDHNRTYALDGKIGIGQNAVVSGFVARTQTPGVDAGREYAFNVRGRTNRPRYDVELGYQEVGERFNPEVGFLSRSGYRKPDARLMTRFRPKDFLFRRLPGELVHAHRQPLAVQERLRGPHGDEPDGGGRAGPVPDLPGRVRAPRHVPQRRGAAGLHDQPGGARQPEPHELHRRVLRRRPRDAQPGCPREAGRPAHLRAVVLAQRRPSARGRLHDQPRAPAGVLLVHHAVVPPGPGPVQRPGRPLVDEPALRLAAGRQHGPVRRLQRHALPV